MLAIFRGACYAFVLLFLCIILRIVVDFALNMATRCRVPIMVICSGSMQPALYRGDVVFFANFSQPKVSDIVAFEAAGHGPLIAHRVARIVALQSPSGSVPGFITRGDANMEDDHSLYRNGRALYKSDIIGKCYAVIPMLGYVSLFLTAQPVLSVVISVAVVYCII